MTKLCHFLLIIITTLLFSCQEKEDVIPVTGSGHSANPISDTVSFLKGAGSYNIDFLENDTFQGNPQIIVSNPTHGTIIINHPSTSSNLKAFNLTYIPKSGFVGTDLINYSLCYGDSCKSTAIMITIYEKGQGNQAATPVETEKETDENICLKLDTLYIGINEEVFLEEVIITKTSLEYGMDWENGSVEIISNPKMGTIDVSTDQSKYIAGSNIGLTSLNFRICNTSGECKENEIIIKTIP